MIVVGVAEGVVVVGYDGGGVVLVVVGTRVGVVMRGGGSQALQLPNTANVTETVSSNVPPLPTR
jgi:hypothetical protein